MREQMRKEQKRREEKRREEKRREENRKRGKRRRDQRREENRREEQRREEKSSEEKRREEKRREEEEFDISSSVPTRAKLQRTSEKICTFMSSDIPLLLFCQTSRWQLAAVTVSIESITIAAEEETTVLQSRRGVLIFHGDGEVRRHQLQSRCHHVS